MNVDVIKVYVIIGSDWDVGDHIISIHKSEPVAKMKLLELDKYHWIEEYELEE